MVVVLPAPLGPCAERRSTKVGPASDACGRLPDYDRQEVHMQARNVLQP